MQKTIQILFVTLCVACVCDIVIAGTEMPLDDMIKIIEPFAAGCEPAPQRSHFVELLKYVEEPSYEAKCLRSCLMKKFNLLTADDKFNHEAFHGMMGLLLDDTDDTLEIQEIADQCNDAAAGISDICEITHSIAHCMLVEARARGYEVPEFLE